MRKSSLFVLLLVAIAACIGHMPAIKAPRAGRSTLVRESSLAASPSRALMPGETALISLETGTAHPGELGTVGEDKVPVHFSSGRKRFCVDGSLKHQLEVLGPDGASVGKATPGGSCLETNVAEGVHTLSFTRAPSAKPGAKPDAPPTVAFVTQDANSGTVRAGQDCVGCDLTNADLTHVPGVLAGNYSNSDFTGARFDGTSFGCNATQCAAFFNATLVNVQMGCSTWGVVPPGSPFAGGLVIDLAAAATVSGWTWPDGSTCRATFTGTTLPVSQYVTGAKGISYTGSGTDTPPFLSGIAPDTFKGQDLSGTVLKNTLLTLKVQIIPGSSVGSGSTYYNDKVDFSGSHWNGSQLVNVSFTNQFDPSAGRAGPTPCGMPVNQATLPDLTGATFTNANLTGALFVGAQMDGNTDFTGATLRTAALCFLQSSGKVKFASIVANALQSNDSDFTDFRYDQLPAASFANASVQGAYFTNTNLTGADFTGAILDSVNFGGANLGGVQTLQYARSAHDAVFDHTSMLGVELGTLDMSQDANAPLGGSGATTAFGGTAVCGADFNRANLAGADLSGLKLIVTPGGTPANGSGSYTLPDGTIHTCSGPYPPEAVTRNAVACPDGNPGQGASGSCTQQQWQNAATAQMANPAPAACCTASATQVCPPQALSGFKCTSNAGCQSCKCVSGTCGN